MKSITRPQRKTSQLWAYLCGVASLFDFTGSLTRRRAPLTLPSVYEAFRSDWQAVGSDIAHAMQKFASQHPEVLK
jgi:hypothetical protein